MSLLSCHGLSKNFGGVRALNALDIAVEAGSLHGLIGPNGSGKTTFFNVISGIYPPTAGKVYFKDREITGLKSHSITRTGISRTFQKAQLIPTLTCLDNVTAGAYSTSSLDLAGTFFRPPFTTSAQERRLKNQAQELLSFVGLTDSANRWAGDLVWVETQLLQIARALAAEPKVLLLDEPSAGMGEEEMGRVEEIILRIKDMGTTIILVAHHIKLIRRLTDRVTAINFGQKICDGTCREVLTDPRVVEAYLGRKQR